MSADVTYQRGFADPEIHGVTRISAMTVDLDVGAYVELSFTQGEETAVKPECQIFGGPEMADKFERLAAAVNDIFGAPLIRPAHLGSVDMFQRGQQPPAGLADFLASDASDDMED